MLQGAINPTSVSRHVPRRRRLPTAVLAVAAGLLALIAAFSTWYATRTQVMDLRSEQQMNSSGLYAEWAKGAVIVLIRHAERCDRSDNTCLSDPAGITVAGSEAATEVGKGIAQLGLSNAELLASPEVRTQQTAHFLFGKVVATQDWIAECDRNFANNAFSHKHPGYNLVLVTHSGCIDRVERQLKVPGGERSSEYASALFVSMGSNGKPRILGQMNAEYWQDLVAHAGR